MKTTTRLTRADVCARLDIRDNTLSKWLAAGLIPAPSGPSRKRQTWDEADFEAWRAAGHPRAAAWEKMRKRRN